MKTTVRAWSVYMLIVVSVIALAGPMNIAAQAQPSAARSGLRDEPRATQPFVYLPLLLTPGTGSDTPSPDVFEETNAQVKFTGSWSQSSDSRASGGQLSQSSTANDTVQFQFSGESVVLLRTMDTDGGQAIVSIDGNAINYSLEFYFPEQRWQVPAIFDHLGAGPHTLTLTVSQRAVSASHGHAVRVDAFRVPSPYVATPHQQGVVDRVNFFRKLVGVPPAIGVQAIHEAAQSHAAYVRAHSNDPRLAGLGSHEEFADLSGFTGVGPSDRARYFGYTGFAGEVLGATVDGFMATVYHRGPLICYDCVDVGAGSVSNGSGTSQVINTGSRNELRPASRLLYTYPVADQADVPNAWDGGEGPDPLPTINTPVGYPISLHIAQPASANNPVNQWKVTVAELRDAGGQLVPTYELDQATDPNTYLGPDTIFLIPQKPMALNASYSVHMAGTDSQGVAFDTTWAFRTQLGLEASTPFVSVGACGAEINWSTPYTSTGTIEYGFDTTYGQQSAVQTMRFPYFSALADLRGLAKATAYHYRIVTKDAQGNTRTSPDYVVQTTLPQTYRVPQDGTLDVVADRASFCDSIHVAAGTYTLDAALSLERDVSLIGVGADQTILMRSNTASAGDSVVYLGGNSVIQDVTIKGSGSTSSVNGILITDPLTPTIQGNRLVGNATGIRTFCFSGQSCEGRPIIRDNVILNNAQDGINLKGVATIVNNTIVGNQDGIALDTAGSVIRNNIVANNSVAGISGNNVAATLGYNDVWNNATNYTGITQGATDRSVDPLFVAPAQNDYHLQSASPAVNAGDPDPRYNDRDGSRNDLGAYGGTY